jgi:hypothetical protein
MQPEQEFFQGFLWPYRQRFNRAVGQVAHPPLQFELLRLHQRIVAKIDALDTSMNDCVKLPHDGISLLQNKSLEIITSPGLAARRPSGKR